MTPDCLRHGETCEQVFLAQSSVCCKAVFSAETLFGPQCSSSDIAAALGVDDICILMLEGEPQMLVDVWHSTVGLSLSGIVSRVVSISTPSPLSVDPRRPETHE
jgi:hypothetical protein